MAFRIAVSGIKAATADLDVTGNNIANANTTGFKASRAEFADLYAASNLGTNQDAIGQGVKLAAVAQQFTQGNVSFTNNSLDMAINGEGFFVLEDNEGRSYTRSGAFGIDKNGYVVNATGQQLLGFQATNGTVTGAVGPLQISSSNLAPQASSSVSAQVNLDAAASAPATAFDASLGVPTPDMYNNSNSLTVYDSLGEQHLATMYFAKTGANQWDVHLRVDDAIPTGTSSTTLTFDNSGNLTSSTPVGFGTYTPPNGADPVQLNVDFTGTTQFGADFGVNALSQDGYTTGRLSGVNIDSQGVVLARFSNGQSSAQGQVLMANFSNPQGLQPLGDSNWAETNDSGAALLGAPGTSSLGVVQSGALEESNVELAEQLVNMIVAQRNFQANAQVIKTEDEVTQTIINIR